MSPEQPEFTRGWPAMISFVLPLKNEESSLAILADSIIRATTELGLNVELIFVDDGSTDGSWPVICEMTNSDRIAKIVGIRFRRNLGKAEALGAGFRHASGEVVFTMDADLQDDPKEIGRFLRKLGEGFDIVCGWKRVRHDPAHKVVASRVFNGFLSMVSGVHLHDHNCGFKCYRAHVLREIALYAGMHRMIPCLANMNGYRSTEIEVTHHSRQFGSSKYGMRRYVRGFLDVWTVFVLTYFHDRPLHMVVEMAIFAIFLLALPVSLMAILGFGWAQALRVAELGALFEAIVFPLVGMGFLAEISHYKRCIDFGQPLPIAEVISSDAKNSPEPEALKFQTP